MSIEWFWKWLRTPTGHSLGWPRTRNSCARSPLAWEPLPVRCHQTVPLPPPFLPQKLLSHLRPGAEDRDHGLEGASCSSGGQGPFASESLQCAGPRVGARGIADPCPQEAFVLRGDR